MLIFSWLWHLSFWESYNPGRIQLNLLSSQVISFITVSSEWWWWYYVTAIWEYFQSTRILIKQMLGFTWPAIDSTSSFQKKPKISSWNSSQWTGNFSWQYFSKSFFLKYNFSWYNCLRSLFLKFVYTQYTYTVQRIF